MVQKKCNDLVFFDFVLEVVEKVMYLENLSRLEMCILIVIVRQINDSDVRRGIFIILVLNLFFNLEIIFRKGNN